MKSASIHTHAMIVRARLNLAGRVQGVGFRPFIYRLANQLGLVGFVSNTASGAVVEAQGRADALGAFERRLTAELPPLAKIDRLERLELPPNDDTRFEIHESIQTTQRNAGVTPDAAVCADCLREMLDPADRRYRYPFINCTNCGPRYSIIHSIPYDRPATTMAEFALCERCRAEYTNPADRRFHAQPIACPDCGPRLLLVRPDGAEIQGDPIAMAAVLLRSGRIVAMKGIGGFHLACDATDGAAVRRLRRRKIRDGKPLAVMVANVKEALRICRLTEGEAKALQSPAAPIVLAPKRIGCRLSPDVAPGCRDYGVMLAYAPLHHLLFAEGVGPLVMTSGNLAGQPLTHCDADALRSLGDVADAFLVHNRPICRPIDDSVVFMFRDAVVPVRRARGLVPNQIGTPWADKKARAGDANPADGEKPAASTIAGVRPRRAGRGILAVGGELKSTVCLLTSQGAVLSEHLGDLTGPETYRSFVAATKRLERLYNFEPGLIAHDLHPQYLSTKYAQTRQLPTVAVQHHHAHIASVMAEWNETGPVIGVACDGTGFGADGTVWGCEILGCERGEFTRLGHLETFALAGGDAAALSPWRSAAAMLYESLGNEWMSTLKGRFPEVYRRFCAAAQRTPREGDGRCSGTKAMDVLSQQIRLNLNAPQCSSLGRLFDAAAFLTGVCEENRHEAEAAMALEEAAASLNETVDPYEFQCGQERGRIVFPSRSLIRQMLEDMRYGQPANRIAGRFHETVARMLTAAAIQAGAVRKIRTAALSGGCFANRVLLARVVQLLERAHLRVLFPRFVPAGDGGISLGQAFVAHFTLEDRERL